MKKFYKILLGIASFWPFLYIPMFIVFFASMATMPQGHHSNAPPPAFFLFFGFHIFTMLLILGTSVFYIVHLFITDKVPSGKKALWTAVLLLGGFIANPVFWYHYIWHEPSPSELNHGLMAETGTDKIYCIKCGTQNGNNNFKCTSCGFILHGFKPNSSSASNYSGVGVIIPYKNPNALISYYLGVFSMIPFIGIPLGVAAIGLGLKGRRAGLAKPELKGLAHAWAGIIMGSFSVGLYLTLGVWIIMKIYS